jgi:hypothetical protein
MLIDSEKLREWINSRTINCAHEGDALSACISEIASLETEQAGIIEQIEMWVENSKQWLMCDLTGDEEYAVYVDDLLAELKRLKGGA